MADWLGATAQALRFYGGCTELIVPDNPKALIANPDRYEPRANDTVLEFARHYNTSVLPARPRRPQDKTKAESAVQVVERWILMRLRHHRFESVDEVNDAIAALLQQLNNKPFQKLPGSRASVFAQIDVPALRALPTQAWELAEFKTVKVHIDSHVQFDEYYYSVPHSLIGQSMEVRHPALRGGVAPRNRLTQAFTELTFQLPGHRQYSANGSRRLGLSGNTDDFKKKFTPNFKENRIARHVTLPEWLPLYLGKSKKVNTRVMEHINLPLHKSTFALQLKARPGLANRQFRLHTLRLPVKNHDLIAPVIESALRDRFTPLTGKQ